MSVEIDDYEREVKCEYKEELYSVRDNGAVMRYPRRGKPSRKFDYCWTFGKVSDKSYLHIAGVVVHRIVATAFHGKPENPNLVVDHIDTNRYNNRPENLRWLTRLENALNNPITRKRIIYHCGSIEAFLKDPSLLRESDIKSVDWMRRVSKEEAANFLSLMMKWVNETPDVVKNEINSNNPRSDTWSFRRELLDIIIVDDEDYDDENSEYVPKEDIYPYTKYYQPKIIQKNFDIQYTFLCYPTVTYNTQLEDYYENLKVGKNLAKSSDSDLLIIDYKLLEDEDRLYVKCYNAGLEIKQIVLISISFKTMYYVHKNLGVFCTEEDMNKNYV